MPHKQYSGKLNSSDVHYCYQEYRSLGDLTVVLDLLSQHYDEEHLYHYQ
jgi:hypothetical protein